MQLLKQILNEMLLVENVTTDEVNSAIDKHERVIINYHSNGEDNNTGARAVDPYAYGLTKAGNPVLRGWQPYGDTTTTVPHWKYFRLDRISSWKPTGQTFTEPVEGFNPTGDDSMSVVYNIAKFDNNSNDVFKTDTERNIERLRQQLNNPINITQYKDKNDSFKQETQDTVKNNTDNRIEQLNQKYNNNSNTTKQNQTDTDKEIEKLRRNLGDTSEPITKSDLEQRLSAQQDPATKEEDVFKTDTERNIERLRQQLNNPHKIDLSQIPKK